MCNVSDLGPAIILTVIFVIMIMGFAGCGGVQKINTGIHIPELDNTQFNDAAYIEGWRNLNEGKPGEAIKRFQESNSVDEKLYVGFGYAFLMQNKLSFAKRNFEKALEINTESLQAQFGIATMHELLNEKEKAFRIYMKLLTDYPGNSWAKARYQHIKSTETQRYLEQAQRAKAESKEGAYITALEKAQTYSPETGAIEIEMAEFYLSQERYEEATRHYENIVERFPDREDILIKLAEVYEKNNKFDSAVIILKKLAAL
ncbi:MAG: tetratricopeptide repeat protein, partial [bacterium]|nr:tetratricopeptide repeat protein [bacterium]